jgi:hypothetical protein
MSRTLAEQERSGEKSTDQVWKAIGNINWMARSADWSQKVAQSSIEKTLESASDQSRLDERAWVSLDHVENTPLVSPGVNSAIKTMENSYTSLIIKNTGRTPAESVLVFYGFFSMPKGQIPGDSQARWLDDVTEKVVHGDIKPGEGFSSRHDISSQIERWKAMGQPQDQIDREVGFIEESNRQEKHPLPEDAFGPEQHASAPDFETIGVAPPQSTIQPIYLGNWMTDKDLTDVIYGTITYRDIFTTLAHKTKFCVYIVPHSLKPVWRSCKVYQYMD